MVKNTTPEEFNTLVEQEGLKYACKEVAIDMMPGIPEIGDVELQGDIEGGFNEVKLDSKMVEDRIRQSYRDKNVSKRLDNLLFETGYEEEAYNLIDEIEEELVEFYLNR